MKRPLENATKALPELESQDGAESSPESENALELLNANERGIQEPSHGEVSVAEWDKERTGTAGLRKLRLLWTRRQLTLYWALVGFSGATMLAFVIPKQYVSAARLMPPEARSVSKLAGGFGAIAGDLLGVSSSGALFVALMRSRTVEDRIIDRFNLKKVYGVRLQQDARAHLGLKTTVGLEAKSGIVALSVTDGDPQRAAAMAGAYVQELEIIMAELNNSSAHRERVFLQDRLEIVKVEMETAEKDFSEFASKNGAMDITEQGRLMIERSVKLRGKLVAEKSQLEEDRQIYSDSSPRIHVSQARISELVNQEKRLLGTYNSESFVDGDGTSKDSFPTLRESPILGVPYESKFRSLKIKETIYETLRRELDSARVQEARENPVVEVLDSPVVPERKSYPPRLLIIALGTGLAIILSGVWILGRARWLEMDAQHGGRVLAREILGRLRCRFALATESRLAAERAIE